MNLESLLSIPFWGPVLPQCGAMGKLSCLCTGLFLGSLQFPAAYEGLAQGAKQKSLPPNLLDFTTHLENG